MLTKNRDQILIQSAIQQIEGAIAGVSPASLNPSQALDAWLELEPLQARLEAAVDQMEDLLVALVDRMSDGGG